MRHAYVIHDTPESEAATVAGLTDAFFDTQMFGSTETLIGAARACPPDLVVAPLGRPEIGGSDLVLALRSDNRTRGVPVVLIGETPVGGSPHPVGEHVHLVTVVTSTTVSAAAVDALACASSIPDEQFRAERHLRVIDRDATISFELEDSLASEPFRDLLVEATSLVSDVLRADFVAVLERTAAGELVPVAAVGFDPPSSESLRHGDSMALLALEGRRPVVSTDLRTEDRFAAPAYLLEAGVAGAVCVEIGTASGRGAVLGAYSAVEGAFGEADAAFLRFVAQLISTVAEGRRLRADLSDHGPDARALLAAATSAILGAPDPAREHGDAERQAYSVLDRDPGEREDMSVRSASEAAHAFANVLQVIGGFAAVLGDRIGHQPELEHIARAVERGASLVGCAQNHAPAEGRTPRRRDTAALLRLVEHALDGSDGVTVSVNVLADTGAAAMDPDELVQSLDALMRNIAATTSGDHNVHVTASRRSFGSEASAAGLRAGTYVVFDVECGRAHGSGPSTGHSAALDPGTGLAAARDAVVRAGGCITFSRNGVGGAAFTVYVPALDPSPADVTDERIGSAA